MFQHPVVTEGLSPHGDHLPCINPPFPRWRHHPCDGQHFSAAPVCNLASWGLLPISRPWRWCPHFWQGSREHWDITGDGDQLPCSSHWLRFPLMTRFQILWEKQTARICLYRVTPFPQTCSQRKGNSKGGRIVPWLRVGRIESRWQGVSTRWGSWGCNVTWPSSGNGIKFSPTAEAPWRSPLHYQQASPGLKAPGRAVGSF